MLDLWHAHGSERVMLQVHQLRKYERMLLGVGPKEQPPRKGMEGDHKSGYAVPE